MIEKHLHILSFDIPYPADYGGVIDVFYTLKSLHQKGILIHLHCFEYGRTPQQELNKYCVEVNYYHRNTHLRNNLSFKPYIIHSRRSEALTQRLLQDDFPILCEGLHTCGIVHDSRFKNRKIIYRASNVEHEYYHHLAKKTDDIYQRVFFEMEALKLKLWEKNLSKTQLMLPVSDKDTEHYKKRFKNHNVHRIFSFFEQDILCHYQENAEEEYVLFHGNLSVPENEEAAQRIVQYLSPQIPYKLIIAGKNPSRLLNEFIGRTRNLELIDNPSEAQMNQLIANAKVHLIITHQATGLKLKLLYSLFSGAFTVANESMLWGTGLEAYVTVSNSNEEIIKAVNLKMEKSLNRLERIENINALPQDLRNDWKADQMIRFIFES
jgi:hypothetical protein